MKNSLVLALLVLLQCHPASARSRIKWFDVQIGAVRITPKEWASTAFVDFAWTPLYDLEYMGFRADFGITSAKDERNARFVITHSQAYVFAPIFSIFGLEVGGGVQTWHGGNGGSYPVVGSNFLMRIGEEFFDRIYLGYARYMHPSNPANEFRSGVAFNFL